MNLSDPPMAAAFQSGRLERLVQLIRAARDASSAREVGFLLVNDTHALAPYRQAALWTREDGAYALSGVVMPEANAPYAMWLEALCRHLAIAQPSAPCALDRDALPEALARPWLDWWPAQALWLPLPGRSAAGGSAEGGLLMVREVPWSGPEQAMLQEWAEAGWHAFQARRTREGLGLRARVRQLARSLAGRGGTPAWRRPRLLLLAALAGAMALPVRLSVLAPGELVPANPVVVRSPLEGIIDAFHVRPNQAVTRGQPLFGFDEALIASKLRVAEQGLATAVTEYRQVAQQALVDARARPQLAQLTGRIEEKRAEVGYLREQLQRARVLAPGDGVVLSDEPADWIGKPVNVGERILRIAAPGDVELEVWLPLADAVDLPSATPVTLYLNANPLRPVSARLRTMSHEAVQRPDGSYAYRIRATVDAPALQRVGLKGTAKLEGERVSLGYWMMRRPIAWLRTALGV